MSKRKATEDFEERKPSTKRQRSDPTSPSKSRSRKKQKDGPPTTGIRLGNFVFFYGSSDIFSQFHPAKFTVDGQEYNCMEQYMHHQKAVTFSDPVRARQILATSDPKTQKKLGRQVENFDPVIWGKKSVEVVSKGSEHKYLQNPEMKRALFATYPRTLVEASPRDRLWGIGLGAMNPKAQDPTQWRGKNLLGKTLTAVRDKLMEDVSENREEENKKQREKPTQSKQKSMPDYLKPTTSRDSKK